MRTDIIMTGSYALQENMVSEILYMAVGDTLANCSMLDIGCGNAPTTGKLPCQTKLFIDAITPQQIPEPYLQADAVQFLIESQIQYDILTALDFIEHLSKSDGFKLLDAVEKKIRKCAIFFIPLGELAVSSVEENYHPHKHWSGWLPEEFEALGYDTIVFPTYHNPWEDGKVYGAFFAYKIFCS